MQKLIHSRFWHYWGTWLPGDLSPFPELRRMQPNCAGVYAESSGEINVKRYYPFHEVEETKTEEEYRETIKELGRIMSNTMKCIADKWRIKSVCVCDWRKGQHDGPVVCEWDL